MKENEDMLTRLAVEEITRKIMAGDQPVEDGWSITKNINPFRGLAPDHLTTARAAYFLGAQHILGSISAMLCDDDGPPTKDDLAMIDRVAAELGRFIEEFKSEYL